MIDNNYGYVKENPISQSLIARTINLAGVTCDRKTIARDIKVLIQFGYKIEKVKGIGIYLEDSKINVNKEIENY